MPENSNNKGATQTESEVIAPKFTHRRTRSIIKSDDNITTPIAKPISDLPSITEEEREPSNSPKNIEIEEKSSSKGR